MIKNITESALKIPVLDTEELSENIEREIKIAFNLEDIGFVLEFCGDKAVVMALNVCYFFDVNLILYRTDNTSDYI